MDQVSFPLKEERLEIPSGDKKYLDFYWDELGKEVELIKEQAKRYLQIKTGEKTNQLSPGFKHIMAEILEAYRKNFPKGVHELPRYVKALKESGAPILDNNQRLYAFRRGTQEAGRNRRAPDEFEVKIRLLTAHAQAIDAIFFGENSKYTKTGEARGECLLKALDAISNSDEVVESYQRFRDQINDAVLECNEIWWDAADAINRKKSGLTNKDSDKVGAENDNNAFFEEAVLNIKRHSLLIKAVYKEFQNTYGEFKAFLGDSEREELERYMDAIDSRLNHSPSLFGQLEKIIEDLKNPIKLKKSINDGIIGAQSRRG